MVVEISKQKAAEVLKENNIRGYVMDIKVKYPDVFIHYYCLRTQIPNMCFKWNINPHYAQQAPNANIIQQESK